MSSQAWRTHCFGPQKGVTGDDDGGYAVETRFSYDQESKGKEEEVTKEL